MRSEYQIELRLLSTQIFHDFLLISLFFYRLLAISNREQIKVMVAMLLDGAQITGADTAGEGDMVMVGGDMAVTCICSALSIRILPCISVYLLFNMASCRTGHKVNDSSPLWDFPLRCLVRRIGMTCHGEFMNFFAHELAFHIS